MLRRCSGMGTFGFALIVKRWLLVGDNQTTLRGYKDGFEKMEAYTIKTLKTIKERVEYILESYPSTQGDDRLLQYRYIQIFVPEVRITFKQFKALREMPAPETISRARRIIQNKEGRFLPRERTLRKRNRREEIIRDSINEV